MSTQSVIVDVEVSATIEAKKEMCDYGVPRSPVWPEYTPTDWADSTIDIAGVTVELSELPIVLKDAIWDCLMDQIDDDKWSDE